MKTSKFNTDLVAPILSGEKTTTWRLFDDKDFSVGDRVECIEKPTLQPFAEVEIIHVREKKLGDIEDSDFEGHNRYESKAKMLEAFQQSYGDRVTFETPVKIVTFRLIRRLP